MIYDRWGTKVTITDARMHRVWHEQSGEYVDQLYVCTTIEENGETWTGWGHVAYLKADDGIEEIYAAIEKIHPNIFKPKNSVQSVTVMTSLFMPNDKVWVVIERRDGRVSSYVRKYSNPCVQKILAIINEGYDIRIETERITLTINATPKGTETNG